MIANAFRKKSAMAALLLVVAAAGWTGCSGTAAEQQAGQPVTGPTSGAGAGWVQVGRVYLDDVRVPSELDFDADESILYETAKFKAGVLRFSKWRLEVESVIDFFMINMPKDKWTFVNAFKGKEAFLTFSKPDKTCTVRITETWTGMVKVAIAVGPLGETKP